MDKFFDVGEIISSSQRSGRGSKSRISNDDSSAIAEEYLHSRDNNTGTSSPTRTNGKNRWNGDRDNIKNKKEGRKQDNADRSTEHENDFGEHERGGLPGFGSSAENKRRRNTAIPSNSTKISIIRPQVKTKRKATKSPRGTRKSKNKKPSNNTKSKSKRRQIKGDDTESSIIYDDGDSNGDDDDDESHIPDLSSLNLEDLDHRRITDSNNTHGDIIRGVLKGNVEGEFQEYVKERDAEKQQQEEELRAQRSTRITTKRTAISLDNMLSEVVYHKSEMVKQISDSVKHVQRDGRKAEMENQEEERMAKEHDQQCDIYVAWMSKRQKHVTTNGSSSNNNNKAPISRGYEMLFGMINSNPVTSSTNCHQDVSIRDIPCTCGIGDSNISRDQDQDQARSSPNSNSNEVISNIEEVDENGEPIRTTTANSEPTTTTTTTMTKKSSMRDVNQQQGKDMVPNLSQINPKLLGYINFQFGEDMALARMDLCTFISKTCPLCLYGADSARHTIYYELVEKIKAQYRLKAFASDHSTLATKLCMLWNNYVFKPQVKKGVKILPFIYEVILDHITKPHVIDNTLVAKSEVDTITFMQMGLKNMIFQVEEVEEEVIDARGNVVPQSQIQQEAIQQGRKRRRFSQEGDNDEETSRDMNNASSPNNSEEIDSEENMNNENNNNEDNTPVPEPPKKKARSVVYRPDVLRDYAMLSNLKYKWLHSKTSTSVFNAQGFSQKRKNVFNANNTKTTIRL